MARMVLVGQKQKVATCIYVTEGKRGELKKTS